MLRNLFNDKAIHLAEVDHNYNMRGDSSDSIGRITTNANQKDKNSKYLSKKEKQFRQIIEKMTSDFYSNMSLWSLSDFQTHGNAYRGWLRKQANEAYENGDYDTFKSLTEQAEEMYDKEQEIINDLSLTEEEKKLALTELWKNQNQELIEEFKAEYENTESEALRNHKNHDFKENIKEPDSNEVKETTTVIPSFNI